MDHISQCIMGHTWTSPRQLRVTALGKWPKPGGRSIDAKAYGVSRQPEGKYRRQWHQVRESGEMRRPQGTHAMRSSPLEINKGLAQAGQRAGSKGRKPAPQTQVWGSSTRPSGNFRASSGTGMLEEQACSKWKHMPLSER